MRIPHSKPFLPPADDYKAKVDEIWQNGWLTNHGPMLRQFETEVAEYLNLSGVSFLSSGTMALQCALRTLERGGEIIVTPYSYVATAGAVFWEGFTPVFADIDPVSLALDPEKAAEKITSKTRAILATHVYGIPADVEGLESLGAVVSTHATKVFHTANGGFTVCKKEEDRRQIDLYRNFGHDGPNRFASPGINGKNSEFHAALGLTLLPFANELINRRREQWEHYRDLLFGHSEFRILEIPAKTEHNGAYFPVLGLSAQRANRVIGVLEEAGVEARRYFNPSLNKVPYLKGGACPVSEAAAESVFCLPLYHGLTGADREFIADIVLKNL
ncbi:MAG: DegT/DnrJ/EryC1/StrS family aminotransferase [Flavobacteriales bacterium]|nr:DegT/DnrJ/EryC1/StrS family aminotransferase [Flavobacteriales bacterium]